MKLSIAEQIRAAGLPEPERERQFHPVRKWKFDYAWAAYMVAAEREGRAWVGGRLVSRHTSRDGYEKDVRKYSEAAILGWLVVRFTAPMEQSGEALGLVERALAARGWAR
jgi:hypothetical protein